MALREIRALTIDPTRGEASLSYGVPAAERKAWLARLSAAIEQDSSRLSDAAIPPWRDAEKVTLTRTDDLITTLSIIEWQPGLLRFRARDWRPSDRRTANRTAQALGALAGVIEAATEGVAGTTLAIRFDPAKLDHAVLIRAAEVELVSSALPLELADDAADTTGLANTTLGLGAVGELVLPVATPLAAGILVATKLGVMGDAAAQLRQGKVGVPLFDTALLTCSIVTGQVLAYALTDWSLRFWQQRWRRQVAQETRQLLEQSLPMPEQSLRVGVGNEPDRSIPVEQLKIGDRVRVSSGERIPADGRVIDGIGLVDDSPVGGGQAALRKSTGDRLLAGSSLSAGELLFEVERTGSDTRAGAIATTLVDIARRLPRERALQRKSEQLAERTVAPTLATAGVGWVAGDLITVGAILHQDWISGPALAVPLVTLSQIRDALQHGALVRHATALQRLAGADFVVFDGDDPALLAPVLELSGVQSHLPDTDTVVRYVAGAGLYLGDERSVALTDACRDRGLAVRRPELVELQRGGLAVKHAQHVIRLTDGPMSASGVPELQVEIDGRDVARLSFRNGNLPRAREALQRARAAGLQTFILSRHDDAQAATMARLLGADLSGGELDAAGVARFLQGLQRRGLRPIYVGSLDAKADLAQAAHVAVDTGELNGLDSPGDVVLLQPSYDSLASLVELARAHEAAITGSTRRATIPNLLCVAGAFAGLLNGITAGLIANVGVMNVDRELRRILESRRHPRAN